MKIIRLESVNSTNTYIKERINSIEDEAIVITNRQTDGYGTNNRKWYSDLDSATFSILIKRKEIPIDYSYKIGCIVSETINQIANVKTYVKKPNDIYLNDKKLAGILIETKYSSDKLDYVVIGIGININQECFPDDISKIATSLFIETDSNYDKEEMIFEIAKDVIRYNRKFRGR